VKDIPITLWIREDVVPGFGSHAGERIARYQPVMRVHNRHNDHELGRDRVTVEDAVNDLLACLQPPPEEWDG
jgi:hypothetical protein